MALPHVTSDRLPSSHYTKRARDCDVFYPTLNPTSQYYFHPYLWVQWNIDNVVTYFNKRKLQYKHNTVSYDSIPTKIPNLNIFNKYWRLWYKSTLIIDSFLVVETYPQIWLRPKLVRNKECKEEAPRSGQDVSDQHLHFVSLKYQLRLFLENQLLYFSTPKNHYCLQIDDMLVYTEIFE